jgi:hypothetical protein
MDSSTVTGAFPDRDQARAAIHALLAEHFESDDMLVYVTAPDGSRREVPVRHSQEMGRGATIGLLGGMAVGAAITTTLSALGARNAGVADSLVFATLQGIAMGAMFGALVGIIVGMAIWRTVIDFSPNDPPATAIIVGARARGRGIDRARGVLERAGATRIELGSDEKP